MVYRLDEIEKAADAVLKSMRDRQVVAFEGELGAGKTTLIQSMCRKLGVTGTMSSPTFSIINEYRGGDGTIYHIDLYRCNSAEEAVRAGVEECIYSGDLCLVEWPSRAEAIFPDDAVQVTISQESEDARKIIVNCKK